MHSTSQPHRFWDSIEDIPSTTAVLAEWRMRLGSDFDSVQSLLRPTDQDAACYQLDLKATAREIAAALGITFTFEKLPGSPVAWRIGDIESSACTSTIVHLVIPLMTEDLGHAIQEIVSAQRSAGVVIAPTRRRLHPSFEAFVRANSGCFIGLTKALMSRVDDGWTVSIDAVEPIRALLARTRKAPDDVFRQLTLDMSRVMLELGAVASDKRRPLQDIAARGFGGKSDSNSLKRLMLQMKIRHLVECKSGPGGGYWLTARGLEQANRDKHALR